MKEAVVIDIPPETIKATRILNRFYGEGWHVVGTLYFGDNSNAAILERDKPEDPAPA
jgi:hypothetical protein